MSSFRQKHPILLGLLILTGIFFLFLGGVSLFISSFIPKSHKADLFTKKDAVGVIELRGLIVSAETILQQINDFKYADNVKAVVLRIESPGGAVGAAQEIYQEIKRLDAIKPVVTSMGSMAASGGYYAALGTQRIIANPGTLTGSIGVIVKFPNFEELFTKIGYRSEVIKSGPLKDVGASNRTMTPEERALMQGLIDNVYEQFVRDIAASRGMDFDTVKTLADGRVFSGEQALEKGLIDRLGNFTDAVALAAELAGIDAERPQLVYPEEEKMFSLFRLLSGDARNSLLHNILPNYPVLSYEWTGYH